MPEPAPNDYIRVSASVFDSPKLADLADVHGPSVFVVWLHLLSAAKRARHLGRIIAPPVRVARATCIEVALATSIIEGLVAARSIVPVGDRPHHYQIRNWLKWQSMTPAERSRRYRDAQRGGDTPDDDGDTGGVTPQHRDATPSPDSVSINDGTVTEPDDPREPARAPAQEGDDGSVAAKFAWVDEVLDHLGWLTNEGDTGVVDYMRSEILQHRRRYDLPEAAYLRAAVAAEKKIAAGFTPSRGTPQGWFLSTVRSHRVETKVTKPKAKADDTGTKYAAPQGSPS